MGRDVRQPARLSCSQRNDPEFAFIFHALATQREQLLAIWRYIDRQHIFRRVPKDAYLTTVQRHLCKRKPPILFLSEVDCPSVRQQSLLLSAVSSELSLPKEWWRTNRKPGICVTVNRYQN